MDFKLFKTREEAEAFVVQKQEQQKQSGHIAKTYGVEERYLVKSQMAFPDAPIEYLMEDNSFRIEIPQPTGPDQKPPLPGLWPLVPHRDKRCSHCAGMNAPTATVCEKCGNSI